MNESNWHREPPPLEAYTRVTNPERFLPLHTLALVLVDQLTADYDVERTQAFALPPDMRPFEHARPPVTLTPLASEAAPIAIGFTSFPGLLVRCGRWFADSFPSCGCDACGADAAGEAERLESLLSPVVAGNFREKLSIPWFRDAKLRWALGDGNMRAGYHGEGFRVVPRDQARALDSGGRRRVQWQPWPRRQGALVVVPAV